MYVSLNQSAVCLKHYESIIVQYIYILTGNHCFKEIGSLANSLSPLYGEGKYQRRSPFSIPTGSCSWCWPDVGCGALEEQASYCLHVWTFNSYSEVCYWLAKISWVFHFTFMGLDKGQICIFVNFLGGAVKGYRWEVFSFLRVFLVCVCS